MPGRSLDEAARRLADGHRALVADRVLEPLASDTHDTQRWMDCDLASFVENRLFETMDPTMLTDDLRRAWTARATRPDERIESPHERAWYLSPFWLLAAGERVGTIALANSLAGADVVSVWSLYVMAPAPASRHRRARPPSLRRGASRPWRPGPPDPHVGRGRLPSGSTSGSASGWPAGSTS